MVLRLYFDIMSQPSRAVLLLLQTNSIPFEPMPIDLSKGEQRNRECLDVNPFGKVPFIYQDDFSLTESVAILQYLCHYFHLPDHWFPDDFRIIARINEFMSWQHFNLRRVAVLWFRLKVLRQLSLNDIEERNLYNEVEEILEQMENIWLRNNSAFINENDAITIADLLAISELEQLTFTDFQLDVYKYPRLVAYIERVRAQLYPYFQINHIKAFEKSQEIKNQTLSSKL